MRFFTLLYMFMQEIFDQQNIKILEKSKNENSARFTLTYDFRQHLSETTLELECVVMGFGYDDLPDDMPFNLTINFSGNCDN